MDENHIIAAGPALLALRGNAQHNPMMRSDFPSEDCPPPILLPNKLIAREKVSPGFRFEVDVLSDDEDTGLRLSHAPQRRAAGGATLGWTQPVDRDWRQSVRQHQSDATPVRPQGGHDTARTVDGSTDSRQYL